MSNQSTELQTTEKEKTRLERLSENRPLDISLKLWGAISAMTTIYTGIDKFILPLFSLPILTYLPEWIGPASSVSFVISGLTLYFFVLRPRKKRLLAENKSLTTELEIREEKAKELENKIQSQEQTHQEQIDGWKKTLEISREEATGKYDKLKEEYKTEKGNWHIHDENMQRIIDERENELLKNDWLFKKSQEQSNNINEYVYVKEFRFLTSDIENKKPFVLFGLVIFNASIFNISIDESLDGEILFEREELQLKKELLKPLITIEPNSVKTFSIKQKISIEEMKTIMKAVNTYQKENEKYKNCDRENEVFPPEFQFGDLKITIKGVEEFESLVDSKSLKIAHSTGASVDNLNDL